MGHLVVRMINPRTQTGIVIALSDHDTLFEYYHDYVADGWVQEILGYVHGENDDFDDIMAMERREIQAHAWMEN